MIPIILLRTPESLEAEAQALARQPRWVQWLYFVFYTALLIVSAAVVAWALVSPAFAQSTQTIPFRRMSEPLQVAVAAAPMTTMVPASRWTDPATGLPLPSFYVVNPNNVWVRAKGFTNVADCQNVGVTPTTGWLWPPGHVAVYSTQFPVCASAIAVPMPGFPVTSSTTLVPLEWSYGPGQ